MSETKEQAALRLWRRWFNEDGDPWIWLDDDSRYEAGKDVCFFCGGDRPNHAPDCVFPEAEFVAA